MKKNYKPASHETRSLEISQTLVPFVNRTAAELLGFSLTLILPEAEIVQCRPTEQGFYCDFLASQPIDEHVITLLEEKFRAIVKECFPITTIDMMRENASQFLVHKGQNFRAEEVLRAKSNIVSLFQFKDFTSFSLFPLLLNSDVGFVRLFNVEEVEIYLQETGYLTVKRLYGAVGPDKSALKKHVKSLEAGKKIDYRSLAREAHLFEYKDSISETGFCWLPSGVKLKNILIDWWKSELKNLNFEFISSPQLVKHDLILNSGINESFPLVYEPEVITLNEVEYVVPQTLTPVHAILFKESRRFNSNVLKRYAECAQIIPCRRELVLRGMEHPNLVTADFAHSFCGIDDLKAELISSLQFIDRTITIFGFKCQWILHGSLQYSLQGTLHGSKPGSNRTGSTGKSAEKNHTGIAKRWNEASQAFEEAFQACSKSFTRIEDLQTVALQSEEVEEVEDEEERQTENDLIKERISEENAMLAGPKAEAQIIDSLGRLWSGPSIELNLGLAKRLELGSFDRKEGIDKSIPVVVLMSIFGSLERFTALLLEHFGGYLPLWLAPEQIHVLPVKEVNREYALSIRDSLIKAGFRTGYTEYNSSSERSRYNEQLNRKNSYSKNRPVDENLEQLGTKIHALEKERVPYVVVVGDKEENNNVISLRSRESVEKLQTMTIEELHQKMHDEVAMSRNV